MRSTRLLWLAWVAVLGGCANYATLQDPETMKKNEFQLGVGATFTSYTLEVDEIVTENGVETEDVDSETFTVPALTLSGRYGATDKLEVHGMLWLPFGASLGTKYMLLGDREKGGFAFSPGIDVSAPVSVSVGDYDATYFDVYVPMHMGYRTAPNFAIYWTPKYVMHFIGGDLAHAAGGTIGVALGDSTQVMLEGTLLYDTRVEEPILNGAIGFGFM